MFIVSSNCQSTALYSIVNRKQYAFTQQEGNIIITILVYIIISPYHLTIYSYITHTHSYITIYFVMYWVYQHIFVIYSYIATYSSYIGISRYHPQDTQKIHKVVKQSRAASNSKAIHSYIASLTISESNILVRV